VIGIIDTQVDLKIYTISLIPWNRNSSTLFCLARSIFCINTTP